MWVFSLACGAGGAAESAVDSLGPPPMLVAPVETEREAFDARVAALPPVIAGPKAAKALAKARTYLDVDYRWEGRDTPTHPGLDCLGLLYRSWGAVDGTPWQRYPFNPSPLVASGRLGAPVPGLAGATRDEADLALLRPGDVLYLLLANYRIPDAPLWVYDDVEYWPWHTALYVGEGRVIEASPLGSVRETALAALAWDGLFVTRVEE